MSSENGDRIKQWIDWYDEQDGDARGVMAPGAVYELVRRAWLDQQATIATQSTRIAELEAEIKRLHERTLERFVGTIRQQRRHAVAPPAAPQRITH